MLVFQNITGDKNRESKLFAATKLVRELDPSAGVMKIQKLLYYIQGWSLAWTGDPLFEHAPQAYRDGPVYPRVREDLTYHSKCRVLASSLDVLTDQDKEIIAAVVEMYRSFSGREMADKTHGEPPWKEARGDLASHESCDAEISLQTMMRYFLSVPDEERPTVSAMVGRECREPDSGFFDRETQKWGDLLERLSA